MRKSALEYIAQLKGQVVPRYNKDSIRIIEEYGKKHGYRFMHAENGGEYFVQELGYFLDAYDPVNNIVLEIDERHHFTQSGALKDRDQERQSQIEKLLDCKFIRIKYDRIL
jgi:replication-associated recombination protein RarA